MAGGLELNPGTGGDKVKTSLSGSFHYQLVKPVWGAADAFTAISAATPLPVSGLVSISGSSSVAVSVVVPGTGAANLGKAEDAAHTSGDVGVMALGVRNDTLAALAGTDGDYAPFQMDADGALYTRSPNLIDANNSTTSVLGGGAAFTGTGTDVSQYAIVTVQLDASHDSATDGMTFQFSTDNTNWDDVYTFTYTASEGARRFQFPVTGQHFRAVYTNGGTLQTHFRLQTILHVYNVLTSIHRLSDDMSPDRSAQVMKTAIFAQAGGSGNFTPVSSNPSGKLQVSAEVEGPAAHDSAVSGSPVLTGLEARTTNPTAVGDGDVVRAMADDLGRQVVTIGAPRDLVTDNHNGSLTLSTTLTLLPAGAAGVFRDLTAITISNPTATPALVTIFDGLTAGTERFRWEFAANGGGIVLVFNTPFKQATANNGWGITSSEVGVSFTAQAIDTV